MLFCIFTQKLLALVTYIHGLLETVGRFSILEFDYHYCWLTFQRFGVMALS
jgi:hypothetical protein